MYSLEKKIETLTEKIKLNWWVLILLYITLVISTYLGIWAAIDPFEIPADLSKYKSLLLTREFLHVSLTLILAAHISLITLVIILKKLSIKLSQISIYPYKQKRIILIAGNRTSIKIIDAAKRLNYKVFALYDKDSKADGIDYARKQEISVYTHSSDELRSLFKIIISDQKNYYYIFIPTISPPWVTKADEMIRSLRKDTKNFRFYRLDIDFDQNIDDVQLAILLN